jgi:putative ABC transport system permease protein
MEIRQIRGWLMRLFGLFNHRRREREFAEELESHLALHTEDNLRAGMSPDEALRVARIKLGGLTLTEELQREQRGLPMLETFWQDLRFGARMLRKQPGFSLIAILALALGIGANTAIFSVVNAVLLRPLPFAEPEQLVWAWGGIRDRGNRSSVAPLDYLDYRAQTTTFAQMAAMISVPNAANLTGSGEPERLETRLVTGNFFSTLGAQAMLGRTFQLENEEPGSDRVVVLSHGLWRRRFGASAAIIGQTISLNGDKYEVLGVMPPGFDFPQGAELWGPMSFASAGMKQRRARFLRPVGRLKPGATLAQAQAEMDNIARRLEAQYPDTNRNFTLRLVSLREQLVGNIKPTLRLLLAAVGVVLLIACANVANLLLVRATARRKELAARMSLGAPRGRIIRQMLTESFLLSLLGGAGGVLLANWGVRLIVAFSGNNIPATSQPGIDRVALGFTLLVSLLTGVLFGLVPAWQATQFNLNETLKDAGRSAGQSAARNRTRSLLVVSEMAIAVVLLIGAGLLLRSFVRLLNVSPGFDAANVLTMRLDLSGEKSRTAETRATFFAQLHERLAALPGVEAVGMITELPLSGQPNDMGFTVEGRSATDPNQRYGADFRRVNEDYLRVMKIPLLRGRGFTAQEARQSGKVILISEALAQAVFPNEDPLGKRLLLSFNEPTPFEIIGVVGDIRHRALDIAPIATMYFPTLDTAWTNLTIRVANDPLQLAAAVRRETQALDREQPVAAVRTMEQVLGESVTASRFRAGLVGLFALGALLLSALGIYGVMSYSVAQRANEIGIRVALGAQTRDVLRLVLAQGLKLTLLGIGIGLAAAFALTRLMANLLFSVKATDPLTFAGVALLLTAVALLASFIPARRATKVDPMIALRAE